MTCAALTFLRDLNAVIFDDLHLVVGLCSASDFVL